MSEPSLTARQGMLLLPGWEDTDQHGLADWLMDHGVFDLPLAGCGLNPALKPVAVYLRHLGLTDEGPLTEVITHLCVAHGRDPDTAAKEAARVALRSDPAFTSEAGPRPPRITPEVKTANAKTLLRAVGAPRTWASPAPVPDAPADQLAAVLGQPHWYRPDDVISVQTEVDRGQLTTVADLILDGPPAPGPKGVWWRANPVSQATGWNTTCKDADTARFEWLLVEIDCLRLDLQLPLLLLAIGLRPAYVVDSGKKSMQAAIRVAATDEASYRAHSVALCHGLAAVGVDPVTINSSRLRRLPGATRPDGRDGEHTVQRLVYLDPEAPVMTTEEIGRVVQRVQRGLMSTVILPIDDIVYDQVKAAPELVEGVLSANSLAVMYGPPGCGKSFIAMDLSLHVATGDTWRDPVDPRRTIKGPVLYIALEGKDGAVKRVHALRSRYSVPPGTPWFLSTSRMNLQAPTCVAEVMAAVEAVKARTGLYPVLIVIDTLARAIGGNENDFEVMGRALDHLGHVQDQCRACIWVVHHTGKDTARGARGHSSLIGAADTMIEVGKEDGVITAVLVKQKDDGPCADLVFRLQQVEVGPGQYPDKPATTCVLEHLPASEGAGPAGKAMERRDADVQRYEEWLELLPQASARSWAAAAGVRENTMRAALKRLADRGVRRHGKDSSGSIIVTSTALEGLPEIG